MAIFPRRKARRVRYVAGKNAACASQQLSRGKLNAFFCQFLGCAVVRQADRRRGRLLIVRANLVGCVEAEFSNPSLDQPERMGPAGGQFFPVGRIRRWKFGVIVELAQNCVHECGGGALSHPLHQFHAFVHRGSCRNAIEKLQLVRGQTESCQYFHIELG